MRKLKPILGVLLMVLSIAGLFYWELEGRESIMTEQILVAKEEIQKGTLVSSDMFSIKGIPRANLIEGALTPKDIAMVQGKEATQLIAENDQVIMKYFGDSKFSLKRGESIFVIDPSWIVMRSSSLRRGDIVEIYSSNGLGLIGAYRVAFVKDASEQEVRTAGEDNAGKPGEDILERTDSTSVIDHIEIISTLEDYENLVDRVHGAGTTPSALIIVQRRESNDT